MHVGPTPDVCAARLPDEHRWIYDYEEFAAVAAKAGIPPGAVKRSTRMGPDLPQAFHEAVRAAEL
eukprot:5092099-Prymnesium_polylepis.1